MKKMLFSYSLLFTLLLGLMLSGCGSDNSPDATEHPDATEYQMGNTNSNLSQGGYITASGEWIYRLEILDEKELGAQLVKTKKEGSEKTVLAEDFPVAIQVLDEWIYYVRMGTTSEDPDAYGIFRIKTDGSSRSRVGEDMAVAMTVADDWILYKRVRMIDGTQKVDLVRCRLDGSDKEVISEEYFFDFQISGDRVIYNATVDNGTLLYSMAIDGADPQQVTDDVVMGFLCEGDWIYYTVDATDYNVSQEPTPIIDLFKVKADGSDKSKITTLIGARPVNVSEEWIYCMNSNEGQQELFRIRQDGSGKEILLDHDVWAVNLIGDRLYYYDTPSESATNVYRTILGTLYLMSIDGTGTEAVN